MPSAALVLLSMLAASPDAPATCTDDQVVWKGRCFDRYQWEPGDPTCPDGVIVVPEGRDVPTCVPCDTYDGMQQPMNFCTGMRAAKADEELKASFEDLVKRLPAREQELRKAQRDWVKKRDAACRRKGQQYEGGSIQPQIENECSLAKTRKRIDELARMAPGAPGAAAGPAPGAAAQSGGRCGGDPATQASVDRRASIVVDKAHFQDEPKPCPADGACPWRRKAYVVRGDEVIEVALERDFACVTYKTTTGWLPLHDLCEARGQPPLAGAGSRAAGPKSPGIAAPSTCPEIAGARSPGGRP